MHVHIVKLPNVKEIMEEKNDENRNGVLKVFDCEVTPNQIKVVKKRKYCLKYLNISYFFENTKIQS